MSDLSEIQVGDPAHPNSSHLTVLLGLRLTTRRPRTPPHTLNHENRSQHQDLPNRLVEAMFRQSEYGISRSYPAFAVTTRELTVSL